MKKLTTKHFSFFFWGIAGIIVGLIFMLSYISTPNLIAVLCCMAAFTFAVIQLKQMVRLGAAKAKAKKKK